MFVALDLTGLWYLQYQVGLDTIPPHHSDAILDLKRGWTGIKITKMANYRCCVPLCNNDER